MWPNPEDHNGRIDILHDLNAQTGGREQCQSGYRNQDEPCQSKHPAYRDRCYWKKLISKQYDPIVGKKNFI